MRSETHLFALFFCLVAANSHAAETPKRQSELSVVLDGQLLATKARRLEDGIYVNVRGIGKALNWNLQSSDSTIAIKMNQASAQVGANISGTITYFFNNETSGSGLA